MLRPLRVLLLRDVAQARLQQLQVQRGVRVRARKRPPLGLPRLIFPGRRLGLFRQAAELGESARDADGNVEGVGVFEVVFGDGQLAREVGGEGVLLGQVLRGTVRRVRLRPAVVRRWLGGG